MKLTHTPKLLRTYRTNGRANSTVLSVPHWLLRNPQHSVPAALLALWLGVWLFAPHHRPKSAPALMPIVSLPPAQKRKPVKKDLQAELLAAVKHDIAAGSAKERGASFETLRRLHDEGAKALADKAAPFAASLRDGEQAERAIPDFPQFTECCDDSDYVQEHFAAFLQNHGMSVRAYTALAKADFRLGDYDGAVHALRIVHLWQPHSKSVTNALAQTEQILRLRDEVSKDLTGEQNVFFVRPYPAGGGAKRWAVLYGRGERNYCMEACFALYRADKHGLTRIFHDRAWGGDDASCDYRGVTLCLLRMTGRRLPELVVHGAFFGAGFAPSTLGVYSVRGNKASCLFKHYSNQSFVLEDLRHNGTYVIRDGYETGSTMCHAQQPRRSDIYAFNGTKYVFADAEFPAAFRDYIQEAAKVLTKYPKDDDLLYNLACMYAMTGQGRKAERCYRKAERYCRERLGEEKDKAYRVYIEQELKAIRTRAPKLDE